MSIGVRSGISGMSFSVSHRSVSRTGSRIVGIQGIADGMRRVREMKVFSRIMPEICLSGRIQSL
jgi:hypothetical protein